MTVVPWEHEVELGELYLQLQVRYRVGPNEVDFEPDHCWVSDGVLEPICLTAFPTGMVRSMVDRICQCLDEDCLRSLDATAYEIEGDRYWDAQIEEAKLNR